MDEQQQEKMVTSLESSTSWIFVGENGNGNNAAATDNSSAPDRKKPMDTDSDISVISDHEEEEKECVTSDIEELTARQVVPAGDQFLVESKIPKDSNENLFLKILMLSGGIFAIVAAAYLFPGEIIDELYKSRNGKVIKDSFDDSKSFAPFDPSSDNAEHDPETSTLSLKEVRQKLLNLQQVASELERKLLELHHLEKKLSDKESDLLDKENVLLYKENTLKEREKNLGKFDDKNKKKPKHEDDWYHRMGHGRETMRKNKKMNVDSKEAKKKSNWYIKRMHGRESVRNKDSRERR